MGTAVQVFERIHHPVDVIEEVASTNEWHFERPGEDELSFAVEGTWCDYHLSLNWRDDLESLHLACAFDLKVPVARMGEVYQLIARINEQLWLGHFDMWSGDGMLMFRHGLMLNEADMSQRQCEALLQAALEACERYYQAFQFVIWAGKSASDALATAMFETRGHA